MNIVTIQNKQVLETLLNNETHYAKQTTVRDLIIPYSIMRKYYGWNDTPVFGCVIGRYAEFYGADTENSIVLFLNIPDKFVKLQIYYDWTDLIYYIEARDKWQYGDFTKFVINTLNGKGTSDPKAIIQATFPYIKPEWLIDYNNKDIENYSNYNGIL